MGKMGVREENEERQNWVCVGGMGTWGQVVTGRQRRKGKGNRKEDGDREGTRGEEGMRSSLQAHTDMRLRSRSPAHLPAPAAQCPVPSAGPQVSGG